MLRRCPAPLIVLAAALAFGLGSQPMSSRADSLTSNSDTSNTPTVSLEYTLTTTQAIAAGLGFPAAQGSSDPPTPQVLALDTPVSIVHPAEQQLHRPAPDRLRLERILLQQPHRAGRLRRQQPVGRHADHPAGPGPELLRPGAGRRQQPHLLADLRQGHRQRQPSQIPQFTVVDPTTLPADLLDSDQVRRDDHHEQDRQLSSSTSPPITSGAAAGPGGRDSPSRCRSWSGRPWPAPGSGGFARRVSRPVGHEEDFGCLDVTDRRCGNLMPKSKIQ